jgi:hypothetical protein
MLLTQSPSDSLKNPGAQGRIRTSVARKERQIYSLLPLTTRPPVQKPFQAALLPAARFCKRPRSLRTPHGRGVVRIRTRKHARILPHEERTHFGNPYGVRSGIIVLLSSANRSTDQRLIPFLELAEGVEPPTL